MDSWSIQHVDLLMISDIQSPKTPKPKISYKMGTEPIVTNGVMVPL